MDTEPLVVTIPDPAHPGGPPLFHGPAAGLTTLPPGMYVGYDHRGRPVRYSPF